MESKQNKHPLPAPLNVEITIHPTSNATTAADQTPTVDQTSAVDQTSTVDQTSSANQVETESTVTKNSVEKLNTQQKQPLTDTGSSNEEADKEKDSSSNAYVVMVIDRSGSMRSMGSEVMNGFNDFLKEQQEEDGICHATVVRFDDTVETLYHGMEIASVPMATTSTFKPRGGTALFDAIVETMVKVERHLSSYPEKSKPDRVMFMILTDGHENQSKTYTQSDVSKNVKRLEKDEGWEFVFIGANQDAIRSGSSFGMKAQNCLTFTASATHSKAAMKSVSDYTKRYRGSRMKCASFTPQERQSSSAGALPCDYSRRSLMKQTNKMKRRSTMRK